MTLAKIRKEQLRARDGAWVNGAVHGLADMAFKVRGRWNPEARALQQKLTAAVPADKKVRTDIGTLEISQADTDRIVGEVLLETVLLDWHGVQEDEASEPLAYNKADARRLLFDDLVGEPLRNAVLLSSVSVAKEGQDTLEADAKN